MPNKTKIEWTEATWNPSVGCDKISAGCRHCYAETMAKRLKGFGLKDYQDGFKFKIAPARLDAPRKIKKPTMFFVNSMSDLFHEKMPYDYLDEVFRVISETPQHIYQVLTKREKIMADYFSTREVPPNVWLGVTVENRENKKRIDVLKGINTLVRFVSFEPLIGEVGGLDLEGVHWAIVGGESGPKARPMKQEWAHEIYIQCHAQNVPFFFKQWGTWGADGVKRSKKKNGKLFLKREWKEMPTA